MTVVEVVQVPEACVASIHSSVPPREERIMMMARMTITATTAAKMQPMEMGFLGAVTVPAGRGV